MKRMVTVKFFIYIGMITLLFFLFFIQIVNNEKCKEKLIGLTEKHVFGNTAPRGRFLDRNGKIIVDNKPLKVIFYENNKGNSINDELKIASELALLLEIDYSKITDDIIKDYYLIINKNLELITPEEYNLYKNRKLTSSELEKLKKDRITSEQISTIDRETAYIYYLMNNGYSYSEKIIKNRDVTELEYATIAENMEKLKGVGVRLDWVRYYPYGNTMRSILGNVGSIPAEKKDEYIKNGYSQDDVVGISYLEYQYDDYLKGKKNEYIIHSNGTKTLLKEGKRGNDIVLNIDIELQEKIEQIIIDNINYAKHEPNTVYLNKSFVILQDAKTGGVIAMAGKQVTDNIVLDYSNGITNNSFVVGSVVKGASHIVGYNTGALKIGEVRKDDCIKIKNTPEKCSFMYLGILNDLTALKRSSNTYQFLTAIKVGGGIYSYNGPLALNPDAFNTYRKTFNEFGLGVYTEIDLPNEKLGMVGKKTDSGLLLDFAIGQYDTYTPIQLSQYITTISNKGIRIKPSIINRIINNKEEIIYESEREELNTVTTDDIYMDRVREGLKEVLEYGGTASGYIDLFYKPSGKTGTSQSFIDTNNDGKIDTETISTTFVAYMPNDDPKITLTVVSPDASTYSDVEYTSFITKRIATDVANAYFKRYDNF